MRDRATYITVEDIKLFTELVVPIIYDEKLDDVDKELRVHEMMLQIAIGQCGPAGAKTWLQTWRRTMSSFQISEKGEELLRQYDNPN